MPLYSLLNSGAHGHGGRLEDEVAGEEGNYPRRKQWLFLGLRVHPQARHSPANTWFLHFQLCKPFELRRLGCRFASNIFKFNPRHLETSLSLCRVLGRVEESTLAP